MPAHEPPQLAEQLTHDLGHGDAAVPLGHRRVPDDVADDDGQARRPGLHDRRAAQALGEHAGGWRAKAQLGRPELDPVAVAQRDRLGRLHPAPVDPRPVQAQVDQDRTAGGVGADLEVIS